MIPLFEKGRILLPSGGIVHTDWTGKRVNIVDIFIDEEMLLFPFGIHPDILDAMAHIADGEIGMFFPSAPQPVAYMMPGSMEHHVTDNRISTDWLDL